MTALRHTAMMAWAIGGVAWAQGPEAGSEPSWRSVLSQSIEADGWSEWAAMEGGQRVRALEAAGRDGGRGDLGLLVEELSRPWPVGAAAAYALGEMGRRDVEGVADAVPELTRALTRMDPRTRVAAAYGIRRIGLADASAGDVATVRRSWSEQGQPEARAWLLEALSSASDATDRADLWLEGVADSSRIVQVAGIRHASGGLDPAVLTAFLEDPDPWIRLEAARALGRTPGEVSNQALESYRGDVRDPWSHIVAARARAAAGDLHDDDPFLRAAYTGHAGAATLDGLVEHDPSALVRAAAASSARERYGTRERGLTYLGHEDPIVQALGAEMLGEHGASGDVLTLIDTLEAAPSEDLARACLAAVVALRGTALPDPLRARLEPYTTHPAPRIRSLMAGLGMRVTGPEIPAHPGVVGRALAHVGTTRGTFIIELRPDWAPAAVANFKTLATGGFFDGQVVHRVVPGFVTQTGCPRGDGWGGPGYSIPDELTRVPFERGGVGMARAEPDSGGSQWFVTHSAQPHLAGRYTQFGRVVQGRHVPERLTVGDRILEVRIQEIKP